MGWRLALTGVAFVAATGCSDGDVTMQRPGGAGASGGHGGDGGVPEDAFHLPGHGASGDGAVPRGEFGDECQDNGDCLSGFCVAYQDYFVCSERCLDEGCPEGWSCLGVANTGADVVFTCYPPGNRLCGACVSDDDCPSGRCYALDDQRICGVDCEADETCPPNYACRKVLEAEDAPRQCSPETRSCTCNPTRDLRQRVCESRNGLGICFGHQDCAPATGWSECDAPTPVPEVCNQRDDDCNGLYDDIAGLLSDCERVVEIEGEEASCRGRLICTPESEMPVCLAREPQPEACNFLDDDCDGETDEAFDDLGSLCDVGVGTCRRVSVVECSEDGLRSGCSLVGGAPGAERCDGLDNDCDGETDEDFPRLNEPCFSGVGACRRAAPLRCTQDGGDVECSAEPGLPGEEVCDGVDNDCDDVVDEGFLDRLFTPCEVGVGACARGGLLICSGDHLEVVCNAVAAAPAEERCNGVDDDCDGEADEAFEDLLDPCTAGEGECMAPGVMVCGPDGQATACSAEAGELAGETCDGRDNDCDGQVDEDFVGAGLICQVGRGFCRRVGVQVCAADGSSVICNTDPGLPRDELCNDIDDDCDGETDEGFDGLAEPCSAGTGACARGGVRICSDDGQGGICNAVAAAPVDERCDSVDNDCDGETDETFAALGTACTAGVGICQRAGVNVCTPEGMATTCNASPGPAAPAELCNAFDDDCDGRVNEDFPALNTACQAGVGACLRNGVQVCAADGAGTTCNAVAGPIAAEICDAVDNDCDAATDESTADLGRACQAGQGVCRRSGVYICNGNDRAGAAVCDAVAANPPDAREDCDHQDDDCDGVTDEGYVDAQGRYTALAHCGSCGNDCGLLWNNNPAAFGVTPRCGIVNNLSQCLYDCLPGFIDADRISNNGCELVVDAQAVYVSTPANGGRDVAACGDVLTPCATIQNGIARAGALVRARVRVSDGVYDETVTLANGISVYGGHNRTTWLRDPDLNLTVIAGRSPAGVHRKSVVAISITLPTTFDGFVVNGESPLTSGNAYAVHVRDSGGNLHITHNRIFAGNGGRGANGANGVPGQIGVAGTAGKPSFNNVRSPLPVGNPVCSPDSGPVAIVYTGGAGGVRACGGVSTNGGAGGGSKCPRVERQEGAGLPGQTAPRGGASGAGAWGQDGTRQFGGFLCVYSTTGPPDAFAGNNGSNGGEAPGGAGAAAGNGSVAANEWVGAAGLAGGAAVAGGGGGGGGAAAGLRDLDAANWDIGATGGGGGSGGCQGTSGAGGAPGGGSFGIFVVFTGGGPAARGDIPDISNNEIYRGLGGTGGDGGNGGPGGDGGVAGAGGVMGPANGLNYPLCSFQGAPGGRGGRGGHGGGGGGGLGGASYDIFIHNENGLAPDFAATNSFGLPGMQATGGAGGEGGGSLSVVTGLGALGNAGSSGNVLRVP